MSNGQLIRKMWKEATVAQFKVLNCPKDAEETKENSQDNRCLGRYLNPEHPEYENLITTRPRRLRH
jgi:hypothetical protein